MVSFKTKDMILIAKDKINQLEYIVTKHLIHDKLKDFDIVPWSEMYYKKQETKYVGDKFAIYMHPFISYEAEQSPEKYFEESVVSYIIDSTLLKAIDNNSYEKIKTLLEERED